MSPLIQAERFFERSLWRIFGWRLFGFHDLLFFDKTGQPRDRLDRCFSYRRAIWSFSGCEANQPAPFSSILHFIVTDEIVLVVVKDRDENIQMREQLGERFCAGYRD
jgi:hypothetical protein